MRIEDLKIDIFRAKGCKDITKGANAVRITHMPTGAIVTCEKYKSYQQNRNVALKELEIRLNIQKTLES